MVPIFPFVSPIFVALVDLHLLVDPRIVVDFSVCSPFSCCEDEMLTSKLLMCGTGKLFHLLLTADDLVIVA